MIGWEKRFADTLEQASSNITEEAERKVIAELKPHGMRTA